MILVLFLVGGVLVSVAAAIIFFTVEIVRDLFDGWPGA